MTVRELIEKLQGENPELEVSSVGADCGGYDVELGTNIVIERRPLVYGGKEMLHICHEAK